MTGLCVRPNVCLSSCISGWNAAAPSSGNAKIESVNRLKTLLQAGALLVGCVAGGLTRVDAALAAAGGCVPWLVLLLGRPNRHIPPGRLRQS